MSNSFYFRHTFLAILLLCSTLAIAQTNADKIKAKWIVENFEAKKNTPQAIKAIQDLQGVCLTFGNDELVISKKTGTCDSVIKRGPYLLSGNIITLGKDQADILLLSEQRLTINIPGQGVLSLMKM